MYARYRTRSRFYKQPERLLKAYGVRPDVLRQPKIEKRGLLRGIYADETVDLRSKEKLELLEEIRHPKERDFYQDHTYHNQWVDRDLEPHQKVQIASRYKYFDPNYAIKPWLWYPGDVVEVVQGSEGAGQRGTIIAAIPYKNEIIVQHVNVQDVVIPASDTRPEQVVQREHPISVERVRHVDPSTNELCTLAMVKVHKKNSSEVEERRISLESGILLPIPPREEDNALETGNPLCDTPIQDADEETYDVKTEQPLLVERKLRAMEEHFTNSVLRSSYEFHQPLRLANARAMQKFQVDVVEQATHLLSNSLTQKITSMMRADGGAERMRARQEEIVMSGDESSEKKVTEVPGLQWWEKMLAPYMEEVRAQEEEQREQEAANSRNAAEEMKAQQQYEAACGDEDEDDEEDVVVEEEEEASRKKKEEQHNTDPKP